MQEVDIKLLKSDLNKVLKKYYNGSFIENDPIGIPHKFSKLQDIEISAFITAMISWGNRKSIINNATQLMELFDNAPYDFIRNHTDNDLVKIQNFKHRTFQYNDALGFIAVLKNHYAKFDSLESAFVNGDKFLSIKDTLSGFHNYFFNDESIIQQRTKKHISTPIRNSACKRLNMFLRWMVRNDKEGVDFGLWKKIPQSQLMIPLDVHVFNISKKMNILQSTKPDWKAVEELTEVLRKLDKNDPIRYDYALFCLGVEKEI